MTQKKAEKEKEKILRREGRGKIKNNALTKDFSWETGEETEDIISSFGDGACIRACDSDKHQ